MAMMTAATPGNSKPIMIKRVRIGPDGRKYVVLVDPRTGQEVQDPSQYELAVNTFEKQLGGDLNTGGSDAAQDEEDAEPSRPGTGQIGRNYEQPGGGKQDSEQESRAPAEGFSVNTPEEAAAYLDSTAGWGLAAFGGKYGAKASGALLGSAGLMGVGAAAGGLGLVNGAGRLAATSAFPEVAAAKDAFGTETYTEAVDALRERGVPVGASSGTLPSYEDSFFSSLSPAAREAGIAALGRGLSLDQSLDKAYAEQARLDEMGPVERAVDRVGGFFGGIGESVGDAVGGVVEGIGTFVSDVFSPAGAQTDTGGSPSAQDRNATSRGLARSAGLRGDSSSFGVTATGGGGGGGGSSGASSRDPGARGGSLASGGSTSARDAANRAGYSGSGTSRPGRDRSTTGGFFDDDRGGFGGNDDDNDKVICTYFHERGELSLELWRLSFVYTQRYLPERMVWGYHAWAIPTVKFMRRSGFLPWLVRLIMRPIAIERSKELAYRLGARPHGSLFGKLCRLILEPFSLLVGQFVGEQDWRCLKRGR